jgi:hypothetical protein
MSFRWGFRPRLKAGRIHSEQRKLGQAEASVH